MGIRISQLAQDRRTVTVPVGDEAVTVTYRPGGFTPETEDRLYAATDNRRSGAALVALLVDTLAEWDLLDDDGQALPVTAETLRQLPTMFLSLVAQAITEDMRPNPSSDGTSVAGLQPKGD